MSEPFIHPNRLSFQNFTAMVNGEEYRFAVVVLVSHGNGGVVWVYTNNLLREYGLDMVEGSLHPMYREQGELHPEFMTAHKIKAVFASAYDAARYIRGPLSKEYYMHPNPKEYWRR